VQTIEFNEDLDEYLDDLGTPDGRWRFPQAQVARQIVLAQVPNAFGRRPQDFLARDFLVGGALRDDRCWLIKKLIGNKDPRFLFDTHEHPFVERSMIGMCRAFHFAHTVRMLHHRDVLTDHTDAIGAINKMLSCPTALMGIRHNASRLVNCDQRRICPFCIARTAKDIYMRLKAEFGRGQDRWLILLCITIADDQIDNSGFASDAARTQWVRAAMREHLQALACKVFHASGGLNTFFVGPRMNYAEPWEGGEMLVDRAPGFEYHGSVLVEVPEQRVIEYARNKKLRAMRKRRLRFRVKRMKCDISVTMALRSCSERDALRRLLVGEWIPNVESRRDACTIEYGAFRYSPWFLSSPEQWLDFLRATKGMPVYRMWGDWKCKFAETKAPSVRFVNANMRRGRDNQRKNLRDGNAARRLAKQRKVDLLIPVIRPVFLQLSAGLGKAPGRMRLRASLEAAGITPPDKLLRASLAQLKSSESNLCGDAT